MGMLMAVPNKCIILCKIIWLMETKRLPLGVSIFNYLTKNVILINSTKR